MNSVKDIYLSAPKNCGTLLFPLLKKNEEIVAVVVQLFGILISKCPYILQLSSD